MENTTINEKKEQQEQKKYILLQNNYTIAYNDKECLVNDKEQQTIEGDTRTKQQIAEDLKKEKFYNTFLKKHYKNIVVLTGAGSSMDNGDKRGKSMIGLWKCCRLNIKEIYKKLLPCNDLLKDIARNKDIERLISHVTLLIKSGHNEAEFLKVKQKEIEEIIRKECTLPLQKEAPHIDFLNKITARKNNDPRVQIFTTNYDTLFEQAGNKAGFVIIDGFSFSQPRQFSGRWFDLDIVNREKTRLKQEESFIQKVFHLYKLHGSLTWEKNCNGEIEQKNNPTNPLMIYPSSEKYESSYEQPYFEMMSRFQQALRKEETLLIIIGLSLADKHLKNVILEAVEQNPSFQLVLVNYGEIKPNEYIKDLFTDTINLKVKRNVTIVSDSFKSFTYNFPENKIYLQDERIQS